MKRTKMDIGMVIVGGLLVLAAAFALWTGGGPLAISGLVAAAKLLEGVWLRLLLGVTLGGLLQVLIPAAVVQKWMGPASGLRGLFFGSYLGLIFSGGPYVRLPIIASIRQAGAGLGPVIALLTATSVISIELLVVWRIPFLGINLALAMYIASFILPPIVGFLGAAVMRGLLGEES